MIDEDIECHKFGCIYILVNTIDHCPYITVSSTREDRLEPSLAKVAKVSHAGNLVSRVKYCVSIVYYVCILWGYNSIQFCVKDVCQFRVLFPLLHIRCELGLPYNWKMIAASEHP